MRKVLSETGTIRWTWKGVHFWGESGQGDSFLIFRSRIRSFLSFVGLKSLSASVGMFRRERRSKNTNGTSAAHSREREPRKRRPWGSMESPEGGWPEEEEEGEEKVRKEERKVCLFLPRVVFVDLNPVRQALNTFMAI